MSVTLSDLANPVVYVLADDVGMVGTESPDEIDNNTELNERLERIRCRAAVALGMVDDWEKATLECSLFPLLTVVQRPMPYVAYGSGEKVAEDDVDVIVRMQALQQTHKAYAGTGTANLGATAMLPRTLVNRMTSEGAIESGTLRFGHPSGVAVVEAGVEMIDGEWSVEKVGYTRTREADHGRIRVRSRKPPEVNEKCPVPGCQWPVSDLRVSGSLWRLGVLGCPCPVQHSLTTNHYH